MFGQGGAAGALPCIKTEISDFPSLGPAAQKPVNANLGLKVNQGLCFCC